MQARKSAKAAINACHAFCDPPRVETPASEEAADPLPQPLPVASPCHACNPRQPRRSSRRLASRNH